MTERARSTWGGLLVIALSLAFVLWRGFSHPAYERCMTEGRGYRMLDMVVLGVDPGEPSRYACWSKAMSEYQER